MARGGIAIGLIAAVIAALLFVSAARKVADQLERHVPARADDVEAAALIARGGGALGDGFRTCIDRHASTHISSQVLSLGSEARI